MIVLFCLLNGVQLAATESLLGEHLYLYRELTFIVLTTQLFGISAFLLVCLYRRVVQKIEPEPDSNLM